MGDLNNDIKRYHNGSMTDAERHALEKKALNDPFLSDALEGTEGIAPANLSADVKELEGKLRSRSRNIFTPLRIAAGLFVVFGAAYLFYFMSLPEPALLSEAKSENAPLVSDSSGPLKDSASNLLTLAEPDKTREELVNPAKPERKKKAEVKEEATTAVADQKVSADQSDDLISASGGSSTTQPSTEEAEAQERALADKEADDATSLKAEKSVAPVIAETQPSTKSTSGGNKKAKAPSTNEQARALTLSDAQTINGQVISAEDNSPLPNVNVHLKGTKQVAFTDAKGNYTISSTGPATTLEFSYNGFAPDAGGEKSIKADATTGAKQSEVLITGDLIPGENIIRLAIPLGGITSYYQYLDNNVRIPPAAKQNNLTGDAKISFNVTINGTLTGFQVLSGLGSGCEEEVIRLVKEGPRWIPSTHENRVNVTVHFDPTRTEK